MQEYADLAEQIAREAGAVMLHHFRMSVPHELKEDGTPVTAADKEINDLICNRISAVYPNHRLIGEEGSKDAESEFAWVFDPIDGTLNFMRGVPMNVCAIALVQNGEPIVGVVYDPYQNRLYRAMKGEGATMNGEPLRVNGREQLARAFIEGDGLRAFKNLQFLDPIKAGGTRFLSYGSTIYAQMLVAAGQLDAALFPLGNPWDAAAAKIIIEEAGGTTSDMRGNTQRYDGTIGGFVAAATPTLHKELLDILAPSI